MSQFNEYLRTKSPQFDSKSPRSETRFEEPLKSSYFFAKPDIVPFPYFNAESYEASQNSHINSLSSEITHLKSQIKSLEAENSALKEQLRQDPAHQIAFLNKRIEILLSENEDLKEKQESFVNLELKQEEKSAELLRELKHFKDAYEDLRKIYAKDVKMQKERFDKLYDEKVQLDLRLQKMAGFEEADLKNRIFRMQNEQKDRSLQVRGNLEDSSDKRLKEIETRLAALQDKLVIQSDFNERALARSKRSDTNTPKRQMSPYSTWKNTGANAHQIELKLPLSPLNSQNSFKDSANGRGRSNTERSPGKRTSPRLSPAQKTCETCVRKHGHEWAKGC